MTGRAEELQTPGHVCDSCGVVAGELDASEECEGCPNEMELIDYVPKHLREGWRFF